jgi:hypothetical protein
MARKSRQSYLKRQKELRRMEKASLKRQRRFERKKGLAPVERYDYAEDPELEEAEPETIGFHFHEVRNLKPMGPGSGTHMRPRIRKPSAESQESDSAAADINSRPRK